MVSKTKNKFIPFALPLLEREENQEVINTLKSGWITTGPKSKLFEKAISDYISSKHAVVVNSCTAALHLSLISVGVSDGDKVITSPLTFASTANVIVHQRATPVFIDIDPRTYNIDPNNIETYLKKNKNKKDKPKAVIPVHYGGHPCDMDAIWYLARKHNIKVIEDAAHAIGSEYYSKKYQSLSKKIGSYSQSATTCFSFYPTKNITTGDGGVLVTDNAKIAENARIMSLHGISKDAWKRYSSQGSWYYEIVGAGYKYNMTDILASLGLHQIKKLDSFIKKRTDYVNLYNKSFKNIEGITLPFCGKGIKHSWHLYPIQINKNKAGIDRNSIIEELTKKNIGSSVHFIPVHLHPYYRKKFGFKKNDFPVAESVYQKIVSLPLYPGMKKGDILRVIKAIKYIIKIKC